MWHDFPFDLFRHVYSPTDLHAMFAPYLVAFLYARRCLWMIEAFDYSTKVFDSWSCFNGALLWMRRTMHIALGD